SRLHPVAQIGYSPFSGATVGVRGSGRDAVDHWCALEKLVGVSLSLGRVSHGRHSCVGIGFRVKRGEGPPRQTGSQSLLADLADTAVGRRAQVDGRGPAS